MSTRGFAPDSWSPDLAERTATALGIPLGPSHWHVIGCARELWASRERTPELTAVSLATGLSVKVLRVLFPEPERSLNSIAGVLGSSGAQGRRSGRWGTD